MLTIYSLQESATTEIYDLEGGHSATWRWRKLPNGPLSAPIVGTSVNPQFLTAGDYSIIVSGPIFCKSETFLVKVIDPAPLSSSGLITSTTICPSTPTTFQFTNTVPNSELYWVVTGGSIIGNNAGNSIEVVFNYPTSEVYSLKIRRLVNNCFSPELIIPLTLPLIPDDIKGITTSTPPVLNTCGSTNQTYTMPFTGADSYTWRIDPPAVGSISSGNGSNSVTVLWNEFTTPTPATLFVDVKNCGITTTRSIVVTVGSPVITMTPITAPICSKNSHPFSIISTPALTSGTVVWDFGDGSAPGFGTNTAHTYSINDTSPTSYTVTATINNPNGCTSPLVVTQTVNVAIAPVALITPEGYRTECDFEDFSPSQLALTATVQSGFGTAIGLPKWYKNGVLLGVNSYTYTVTDFGSYQVEVTNGTCSSFSNEIVFEKNCSSSDQCIITPDPALTLVTTGECGNYTAVATYSGTPSINWKTNGKVTSDNYNATYSFKKAGYYNIGYSASYTVGSSICVVSKSNPITVPYVADIKYKIICPV